MLIQPGGIALVEVRARRFRQRFVRSVADEQVAEADAVLADELWLIGSDQSFAHEGSEVRRHLGLVG